MTEKNTEQCDKGCVTEYVDCDECSEQLRHDVEIEKIRKEVDLASMQHEQKRKYVIYGVASLMLVVSCVLGLFKVDGWWFLPFLGIVMILMQ
jgi:ribosomal protein S26